MIFNTKEVLFSVYCPKCKYENLSNDEEPCNSCLAQGFNYDSHKPWEFKDKEGSDADVHAKTNKG